MAHGDNAKVRSPRKRKPATNAMTTAMEKSTKTAIANPAIHAVVTAVLLEVVVLEFAEMVVKPAQTKANGALALARLPPKKKSATAMTTIAMEKLMKI